jgi:hypothetical protein
MKTRILALITLLFLAFLWWYYAGHEKRVLRRLDDAIPGVQIDRAHLIYSTGRVLSGSYIFQFLAPNALKEINLDRKDIKLLDPNSEDDRPFIEMSKKLFNRAGVKINWDQTQLYFLEGKGALLTTLTIVTLPDGSAYIDFHVF